MTVMTKLNFFFSLQNVSGKLNIAPGVKMEENFTIYSSFKTSEEDSE